MSRGTKQGECDVCVLLDEDHTSKTVGYCPRCDAWMCERCRKDLTRRARAAGKKAFRSMSKGLMGRGKGDDE